MKMFDTPKNRLKFFSNIPQGGQITPSAEQLLNSIKSILLVNKSQLSSYTMIAISTFTSVVGEMLEWSSGRISPWVKDVISVM